MGFSCTESLRAKLSFRSYFASCILDVKIVFDSLRCLLDMCWMSFVEFCASYCVFDYVVSCMLVQVNSSNLFSFFS